MNNFRKAAGIASALMVLFVLFQLIINGSPISSAGAAGEGGRDLSNTAEIVNNATVSFSDYNNNTVPNDQATVNDIMRITYDWAIPDGLDLQPDDYVKFKLPDQVTVKPMSGKLDSYGTYDVSDDGTVTLTFNEKAVSDSGVKGTFTYGAGQLVSRGTLFRHPFVTLFRPETTLFRRTNVTFLIFNLVIRQIIPSVGLEY